MDLELNRNAYKVKYSSSDNLLKIVKNLFTSKTLDDLIKQYHPGVQPTNILMTGDRLDTDILFAKKNNIHSL